MGSNVTCDICGLEINSEEYTTHLNTCVFSRLFRINFVIDERTQTPPIDVPQNARNVEEEEYDDADDDEQFILSTSPQVVNGVNIRNFMEEHLGGFVRQYTANNNNQEFSPMNVMIIPTGTHRYSGLLPVSEYEANLMLAEHLGKVEVGVSNIDDVSEFLPICLDEKNPEEICTICREILGGDDENTGGLARILLCGHKFCDECITMWLKKHKTCPLCLSDLDDLRAKKN